MNAFLFIENHGIDKAERIVNNVVCDAEYYSDSTGSYYSSNKNDSVGIKSLRQAIREYKALMLAKSAYEARLQHWKSVVGRAIANREACQ